MKIFYKFYCFLLTFRSEDDIVSKHGDVDDGDEDGPSEARSSSAADSKDGIL